jgi:hypothetical protein
MNFFEFLANHGFGALIALWVVCYYIASSYRLRLRAMNIQAHGWPPQPLDADGDVHHLGRNCADEPDDEK